MSESPIIIEPPLGANAAVVWLHGLGADGSDFEPVAGQLPATVTDRTRFVFPHAPICNVTVNGGALMRAWYDILEMDIGRRVDEDGVRRSAATAAALVDAQCAQGIDSSRIVLAGFSQGGAVALHAGLRHPQPLAGIMALSTYLAVSDGLDAEGNSANASVSILLAHGSQDPVVPLGLSEAARLRLSSLGYRVQTHTYPMQHAVCAEELRDIGCWLEQVLS